MSFDTIRANEALQAGALPIVEASDYWSNLYGSNHPLIMINNWDEAPALIHKLLENKPALEKRRMATVAWWQNYKEDLTNKIATYF
jgi:hypothetical protein